MSDSSQVLLCYTTVKSLKDGKELAQKAIQDKVAGCVNIIPGILSVYPWNDGIQNSTECIVLFKLVPKLKNDLAKWLDEHHPYELPAQLFWLSDVSDAFANYIRSGVAS